MTSPANGVRKKLKKTEPKGRRVLSQEAIEAAQTAQRKWRVWSSVSLAQYWIESSCGLFEPPKSNNPFGIQELPGLPSVAAGSHEWRNGVLVPVTERFACFASLSDAFDQHAKLLATLHCYWRAMAAPSAELFALALTGVYSTTPGYGSILVGTMRSYRLEQYDLPMTAPPAAPTVSAAPEPKTTVASGIVQIQQMLVRIGYKIAVDGFSGPQTTEAVRIFQFRSGLPADGIAGPETLAVLQRTAA